MNSFLTELELSMIGFARVGANVLISRHARIYNPEKISIGDHVRIDDFCILSGKIVLGNFIHIAAYSALFGGDVGIEMLDYSGLSSRVSVYAISDDYSGRFMTNPTIPIDFRHIIAQKVIMKKHVIVGSGSVVLPGVILEEGCAVGSMSLVNKSTLPWSVNVGIPAKFTKERSKLLLEYENKVELKNHEK